MSGPLYTAAIPGVMIPTPSREQLWEQVRDLQLALSTSKAEHDELNRLATLRHLRLSDLRAHYDLATDIIKSLAQREFVGSGCSIEADILAEYQERCRGFLCPCDPKNGPPESASDACSHCPGWT